MLLLLYIRTVSGHYHTHFLTDDTLTTPDYVRQSATIRPLCLTRLSLFWTFYDSFQNCDHCPPYCLKTVETRTVGLTMQLRCTTV